VSLFGAGLPYRARKLALLSGSRKKKKSTVQSCLLRRLPPPRCRCQLDLVQHHQTQPFPDGSRLVTVAPAAAVDEEYLDIVDPSDGDDGGIPGFQADPGAEPKHKYVNISTNATQRRPPRGKGYTNIGPDADHFRLSCGIGDSGSLPTSKKGYVNASPQGQPLVSGIGLVPEAALTAPVVATDGTLPPLPQQTKKRYVNIGEAPGAGTRL